MSKVIFTVKYEIKSSKKEEYLEVVKEMRSLMKFDGLESYNVYEVKGKKNNFQEVYKFSSEEDFEAFDDNQTERISLLLDKLSSIIVDNSTKYGTLLEI